MELTIEEALQQAVAAHKEGKLQDAERLYRAILESHPLHPDANHNLGILLASLNKADAALPLFKTALEANPKIEQFWVSYIGALVVANQLKDAKQAIKKAKKKGFNAKKLDALLSQLKMTVNTKEPTQEQLVSLLEHYQNARLGEAEKLAMSTTQEFPKHQFGWKVLGAVLKQTGRLGESLVASENSLKLAPHDAEAYNNLGNTLKELGRSEEAEASYTQAIALKPDYALARFNLGVVLQKLGRLDEAEASYTHAIAHKPDFTKAHNSLLKCLYLLDKKSLFIDQLDFLINQDKANAVIGSLTCRSALKYGLEKPNIFCNEPLKYVLHTDMNTQYDFEEIFVKNSKYILNDNRLSNRKQPLLHNGYQTSGNLFDIKTDLTEKIHTAIRIEIEKYRINFKNSHEGLIKKWPTDYSLYGWLISMSSGGEIKPHIHEEGWLSGSIYINVPSKSKADSGNLVISLGEKNDATDARLNMEKIINVVTGSLVLFPASLTHYTIPFESEEERIVLAFDVIAK
jgi:tetratricopeptide (TPR) repeat protein